jgi:hypothetical protein
MRNARKYARAYTRLIKLFLWNLRLQIIPHGYTICLVSRFFLQNLLSIIFQKALKGRHV